MTNSVKMPSSSSSAPDAPDASSSAATPVESKVDVLIIGAGPAGVMAANGLAKAGVDVRIVDKRWVLLSFLCLIGFGWAFEVAGWFKLVLGFVSCIVLWRGRRGTSVWREGTEAKGGTLCPFPWASRTP